MSEDSDLDLDLQTGPSNRRHTGGYVDPNVDDDSLYPDMTAPLAHAVVRALPTGKPKGPLTKSGQEAKSWARRYVDDPRWDKMIWFWIENPEMMPPGVFSTIMFYRYGKPPQTVKVKGEIMARPYLGEGPAVLAKRARQLADRLAQLSDPAARAKVVGPGSDTEDPT